MRLIWRGVRKRRKYWGARMSKINGDSSCLRNSRIFKDSGLRRMIGKQYKADEKNILNSICGRNVIMYFSEKQRRKVGYLKKVI